MGVFMLAMAPMLHVNEMVKMEKSKNLEQLQLDESGSLNLMTTAKVITSINPFLPSLRTNQYCAMIGVTSGILSGVFGVGGGAIMVPALCLFTDMDYRMVIGKSFARDQNVIEPSFFFDTSYPIFNSLLFLLYSRDVTFLHVTGSNISKYYALLTGQYASNLCRSTRYWQFYRVLYWWFPYEIL